MKWKETTNFQPPKKNQIKTLPKEIMEMLDYVAEVSLDLFHSRFCFALNRKE